jgi:hypothetical protein
MNESNGKHDLWCHRAAIIGTLAVLALDVAVIGAIAWDGREVPSALTALALTSTTAIASMLHAIMGERK